MLEELKEANNYVIGKIQENRANILEMERYALENNVPIVTKEVAKYLEFMIKSYDIKKVLEIGTAIGYSTSLIRDAMVEGKIVTIEIDEERYEIAKKNLDIAKKDNVEVKMILGDAVEKVKELDEKFDFVFIDASKGHYLEFFNDSFERVEKGGIIFIDNIMFRGYLYKEYPKRFKTIVKRLDQFIDYLSNNYDFTLLPFGDGIGLVRKG